MKKGIRVIFKFVFGFACVALTFWSCTNDINDLGKDLLLPGDLINVKFNDKASVTAFNRNDEKQRTDNPRNNLLGTVNDPVFGKTTAGFACQFRLINYPEYKENDIIDSLVYSVYYKEIYGDTLTPQKLRVYELNDDLILEDENGSSHKYFQDIDLKALAKSEILAEMDYIPKFKDTLQSSTSTIKDTVTQEIAFHLNHSLARKLMAADTTILSKNDIFTKYFKGLYVESGDLNQGGTVMKVTASRLVLYFRNSVDTLKQAFYVTESSARVNRIVHDYTNTTFLASLDTEINQENLIYLQSTGGLRTKLLIPSLENWRDSVKSGNEKIGINKAELIFQIDPAFIDTIKFLPPEQLLLAAIGKSKANQDSIYYLSDYYLSPAYFGGWYNSSDKTYRFNIAKHLEDIIKGKQNLGFYLETVNKNSSLRRVVLKGTTGIRLEVTYSKIE